MRKTFTLTSAAAVLILAGGLGIVQRASADAVVVRVYDRYHRDYHNWDANEDRVYRSYREGRHEPYRAYRHLDRAHQRGYWSWRHEHADSEQH